MGLRFWLACVVLVPANLIWSFWTLSVNPGGPWFDECPLLANVVVFLLLLVGFNGVLRRFRPRWVFTQTELLLLYTVLAVSTAVGGVCYGGGLAITIGYPYWFGLPDAPGSAALYDWRGFLPDLPDWLIVSDVDALRGFWEGGSTAYRMEVLRAWSIPLLAWTGFVVCAFVLAMCLNVLVRRHWVHSERLTFPIVWLPIEMTRPNTGMFRSGLLWVGFGAAFLTQILNGLNYFYPTVPYIPTKPIELSSLFPDRPWSAMNDPAVSFHPLMIGLGFLLPQDLLFSCWFFHLFWQAERVAAAAVGFSPAGGESGFPYIPDQTFGAALALGLLALWGTRHHLRSAWQRALGRRRPTPAEQSDALSARAAFLGIAVCALGLIIFLRAAGMSWLVAAAVLALTGTLLVAITRIRAESGGPLLDMRSYLAPGQSIPRLVGEGALSRADLTGLALTEWHVTWGFNQPMPYGLEALKMAQESRREQGRFFIAAVAAVIVGMVGTLMLEMHFAYRMGEAAELDKTGWAQTWVWRRLDTWINEPQPASVVPAVATLSGAAMTVFLTVMRTRFVSWPFHPVPYATTGDWGVYMAFFWMPFLIAWAVKGIIIRYQGLRGFHRALPFFLGLIMGEMSGGMLWPLYGMLTGTQCYSFFGA